MIGFGIVGYGYWGPNLARNIAAHPECQLVAVCDLQEDRRRLAAQSYPHTLVTPDYQEVLSHPGIQAVAVATPVGSHFSLGRRALLADKDVLVEKPITRTVAEAEELIRLAGEKQRILAVDHTFLYCGAVQKIKAILDSGELGELLYFDSVRINLGLFQHDVNVIHDLAPHDLSILCHLVNEDPVNVQALGACHAGNGLENLAYLHLEYENNLVAHCHLNWLAPVKIRRTLIGGTRKMIVYDDMEPSEKVKVYDKGIVLHGSGPDTLHKIKVDYRIGDMVAPKLNNREALQVEIEHFVRCVQQRTQPLADGRAGLRVVRIIEAAERALNRRNSQIKLRAA